MQAEKIESSYQLSPMQQGMLFHSLLARHSGVYIQQMCCALREALDETAFVAAWERVAERHAVLRTSFHWGGIEGPLQLVHERVELSFERHDWGGLGPAAQERRLDEYVAQDRRRGFEPERAPLMRLALFRMAEADYRLLWTSHHALFDGRARLLLLREVFALYQMIRGGRQPQLPAPRPYGDFIEWLRGRDLSAAEAFWREELKGFNAPTPVGAATRAAATADGRHAVRELRLSANDTSALRSFAQRHELNLNIMLQGAWALFLSRHAGVEDVAFGITRAGRRTALEGAESMVGLLINTVPVRVRVEPDAPLLPWLKNLRARGVRLREFEHTPLVRIQDWSEVPAGRSLFESIFVFESYQLNDILRSEGGDEWSNRDFRLLEQTDYPLALLGYDGDELLLKLAYNCDRFGDDDAARMLGQLHTLLLGMASGAERRLCELPLLTEVERRRALFEWNDTATPFAREACIHELFAAQVRRSPDAVAVVDERERLTYRELDERAERLARRLHRLGVGPDSRVALLVERSSLAVVSILAVLKAGGAYVPLDPEYPRERLAFMLEDSRAKALLTVRRLAERAGAASAEVLLLDEACDEVEEEEAGGSEAGAAGPDNLAYVIYTSGSTGRPKGVMVQHRGLCNLSEAQIRAFDLRPGRQVLQFASLSFDASASEIFTTLLSGATLHLADRRSLMPGSGLVRLLRERGITTVTLPPTVLASLTPADVPGLQTIVSAGEACPAAVAEVYCSSGRRFLNAYGPTEATVCATISYATDATRHASIGRALSNAQVYVLDARLEPVPPGVSGELYVGGAGLARGYLSRPALTAERFIPNPFSGEPGARLYRTGDAARYLADGCVEFIGRLDQQVKLRGFRIEPGEVEAALRRHTSVRDAAVIVREDDAHDRRLVAYFTARGTQAPTSSELRQHVERELPEYMVPSAFVFLERLPLSPNGKVDRRALPAPGPSRPDLKAPYVAPRTPTEELLASVWGQVLGLERVGVNDTFLDLGGHSLLAAQVVSKAQEIFKVELPLSDFFASPTVAGMAEHAEAAMRRGQKLQTTPIHRRAETQELPLSFAQQRLWLLDQLQPGSPAYNIPKFLRLRGRLDLQALEHSLNEVVRRHEALRTTFVSVGGRPTQRIAPELRLPLRLTDLSALDEGEREAQARRLAEEEARRPFDLAAGPLLRASLLRLSDEDHAFALTLHHIISDGWSLGVLLRELSTLYDASSRGERASLPALPIQYADYALWQRSWLRGDPLERRLAYWRQRLAAAPELLALPADRPRPAAAGWAGDSVRFEVSAATAAALRREARRHGVTLFMLLLAAFKVLLWRHTGEADLSVGTPAAGRDRVEVEGLIGFFVNTLVLRTQVEGRERFAELVGRVREACLGAYQHQEVPFEKLVEELAPGRSLAHAPLFQVMFTVAGAEPRLSLSGVRAAAWEVGRETTKFDLTCGVGERTEGTLGGVLQYSTELFDAERMEAMARRWERVMAAVAAGFDAEVRQLPTLLDEERALLLDVWNEAGRGVTEERDEECLHHLFERQAAERGEEIALVYEGERLTYRELDERAEQLARRLRRLGVGPDSRVALLVERSSLAVVSILAVLKAGGAYLPLDTSYPSARLAMMLEDSRPVVLLATPESARRAAELEGVGGCALEVVGEGGGPEWEAEGEKEDKSSHAFESDVRPGNLAYVIYTSGSTGKPKGVMIEHRQIVNYVHAVRRRMGVGAGDNFALVSTLAADLGHTVLFPSLCSGGTLHVVSQWRTMEAKALGEYFQREAIDCVKIVPSHLRALLASGENPAHVLPRRLLVLGGEATGRDLLDEVKRLAPGCRVMNHYGPTETTVGTLTHEPESEAGQTKAARGATIALGRPLGGTRAYVLDADLQLVPPGSRGELFLAGDGLARGYLGRPALTAERFVPDPFAHLPGSRLYRTGDLCRHLLDGRLEFLGRADHQVKVRGFRVELGEVEAALCAHQGVREAVAVARDDDGSNNKRLVAYLVPRDPSAFSVGELRDHLKAELPGHVVPSAFVLMERLPLTAGGKLDRAALPPPEYTGNQTDSAHSEPRTQTEEVIAKIFCQTLGLKQVGVEDNFFELGGHSLLATQVISRVRELLRVELSLRALFEAPTVSGLARLVTAAESRPGQTETIARLLMRVRRMSPEDTRRLLQKDDQT